MNTDVKYPNIEAERVRHGYTKNEFCEKMKICRKIYYNWINKGKIPQSKVQEMAKIFGCSIDYLLGLKIQYPATN